MNRPNFRGNSPAEAIARLESCRLFEGNVKDFWQFLVQTCAELVVASAARIILRAEGNWRLVAGWPDARDFPLPMAGPAFKARSAARIISKST